MDNPYLHVIKDFLTPEECGVLSGWILDRGNAPHFKNPNMGEKRITTRFTYGTDLVFPPLAYEIRKRIAERLHFTDFKQPGFKDGMVASHAKAPDSCCLHKDPVWYDGHRTFHCNVIVAEPEAGGNLLIEGTVYKMNRGDLVCYPVSDFEHGTDAISGLPRRLLWIFGFCLKNDAFGLTPEDFSNGNWKNKFGR